MKIIKNDWIFLTDSIKDNSQRYLVYLALNYAAGEDSVPEQGSMRAIDSSGQVLLT
jgi:hypothetical protein